MAPPRTNRTCIRAANRWHPQSKPILLTHMLVINHLHQRELVRNSSTQALSLHYRKVFTFISLVDSQYMTPNDPAGQKFIHAWVHYTYRCYRLRKSAQEVNVGIDSILEAFDDSSCFHYFIRKTMNQVSTKIQIKTNVQYIRKCL